MVKSDSEPTTATTPKADTVKEVSVDNVVPAKKYEVHFIRFPPLLWRLKNFWLHA